MRAPHTRSFTSFRRRYKVSFPSQLKPKMFLSLAESITQTLNVTLCYVCGGINMGDHWAWEAKELNPQEPFNKNHSL
jgi:hypothetical protein